MKHRWLANLILATLGTLIPWHPVNAAPPAPAAKPNIVFFLADDLGYMDIGANNPKTFYHTPRIDSIAAAGMRFTSGYAACPVCSPTRASIMTGKYPVRTGITDYIGGHRTGKLLPAANKDHLALEEVTIAEALRDAGYTNFFAGKWHLGKGEYSPNAQGFGPGLVGQQFWYPPSNLPPPDPKDDPKTTDRIADEAVRFIEANTNRPFFAYLPFQAVHIPIGARQDLIEKYRQKPAPPEAWGQERQSKVRLVQTHPAYAAMLEQMDSAIGRVLDTIDHQRLGERTIVTFMSDNGGLSTAEGHPTSNLPLRGGKGWPYEGGIREPWFIRAPGVTRPGSICDTPVSSPDFYPTLLALAGLPLKPKQHCDGVSLLPLLQGKQLERGPLFWHYPPTTETRAAPRVARYGTATGSWSNGTRITKSSFSTCAAIPARRVTLLPPTRPKPEDYRPNWPLGARASTPRCPPSTRTSETAPRWHPRPRRSESSEISQSDYRSTGF